jgi:proteasome accessory factor B
LSLFIAARLLSRQSGEYDPHVVSMLEKLAETLPSPVSDHLVKSAQILQTRPKDSQYITNLEILMRAWVSNRRVRMWYQSAWKSQIKDRLFDVYFIEPLEQVFSCYVIGLDHSYGEVRTFKVKRIKHIELTDDSYSTREGFDIFQRWANSWGIVMAPSSESIHVKLRFTKNLAFMIKEAIWHQSQKIEDTEDGGCIFTATVDHTLGIKIWIRTWGPDVEVLEPHALRLELAYEAHKLQSQYQDVDLNELKEYSDKYLL